MDFPLNCISSLDCLQEWLYTVLLREYWQGKSVHTSRDTIFFPPHIFNVELVQSTGAEPLGGEGRLCIIWSAVASSFSSSPFVLPFLLFSFLFFVLFLLSSLSSPLLPPLPILFSFSSSFPPFLPFPSPHPLFYTSLLLLPFFFYLLPSLFLVFLLSSSCDSRIVGASWWLVSYRKSAKNLFTFFRGGKKSEVQLNWLWKVKRSTSHVFSGQRVDSWHRLESTASFLASPRTTG